MELVPTGPTAMIVILTIALMLPFAAVYLVASRTSSRKLAEVPAERNSSSEEPRQQSRAA